MRVVAALLAGLLLIAPALADPPLHDVVTRHQVTIGKTRIAYTATAADTTLSNLDGDPIGSLTSFAYVKDGPADPRRPVLFVFNGGPGSSSLWLHMGVVGPRRVQLSSAVNPSEVPPFRVVDNPDSLLDVADIVFIDPIGTGYSRIVGKGTPEDFYGVDEDANSVAQFIELWLGRHGRWNSPKFVMGESYGSTRAALLPRALLGGPTWLGMMRGVTLNGIVLLGTTLGSHPDKEPKPEDALWSAALQLPGFAATAWYHDKIDRAGRSLAAFYAEASHYAQTDYIDALRKGAVLDDTGRAVVAARLASFTGLPAASVPKDLVIPPPLFCAGLLADRGLNLGAYDSRYTLPALHTGHEPVADDPAMTQYVPGFVAAFHDMLGRDLKAERDVPYLAIHWRGLLDKWRWERAGVPDGQSMAADLATAMRRQPKLRVLVASGYYDLTTQASQARHDIEQAGVPSDRVTFKLYESGHMLYIGDTAHAFAEDVRTLIREAN